MTNRPMSRIESMAYLLGQLDEVDRYIKFLQTMRSKGAREKLRQAEKLRDGVKKQMEELTGL